MKRGNFGSLRKYKGHKNISGWRKHTKDCKINEFGYN